MTAAVDRAPFSRVYEDGLCAIGASVPKVRNAVTGLLANAGVPRAVQRDVGLAATEACANAVMHGYVNRPPAALHLRAELGRVSLHL